MAAIAILHGTLTPLLAQSSGARAMGLEVCQAAADRDTFRQGLATHRIDALVLGLDRLGDRPLAEINQLQRYTRPRVTLVMHSFSDAATVRALQAREDVWLVREPVTRARLQGLLARALGEPELTTLPYQPQASREQARDTGANFDQLVEQTPPGHRYDDVQLNRLFEDAVAHDYEFTQHVAELLIQIDGFEAYCQRRNRGRENERGLHNDVARGAAHARVLLEECLHRLITATRLSPGPRSEDIAARVAREREPDPNLAPSSDRYLSRRR